MASSLRVIAETDNYSVIRRGSNGVNDPARIQIKFGEKIGNSRKPRNARVLDITIDELFELTEILDDLCDEIEDEEEDE